MDIIHPIRKLFLLIQISKIMRWIIALYLMAFGALVSCNEIKDGGDTYYYHLAIKFVDQSGENLLNGIECNSGEKIDFSEEYKLIKWVEERRSLGGEESDVYLTHNDGQNYLLPDVAAFPRYGFYSPIIVDFTCHYIFGDNQPHEIVSEWKKKKKLRTECTKVTVDGKQYDVVYNEALSAYTVTVVID